MTTRTQCVTALTMLLALPAAAGNLEPSAPPGPTMKTLAQVEPRTAISTADTPRIITQPGSYYLTENLNAIGFGEDAITIQASGVTIDLMGFSIQGSEVGIWDNGIVVVGERDSVTVKNGTVRDCVENGVDLNNIIFMNGATNSRVESIRAIGNGGIGVWVDTNSLISGCLAMSNGGDGFHLDGSRIENSTSSSNGGDGIYASNRSTVTGCTASENTGSGAFISVSAIINSTLTDNQTGITATSGSSSIVGNEVHLNTGNGISLPFNLGDSRRIDGNNVTGNGGWGIIVQSEDNLIVRNVAANNDGGNYSIDPDNAIGAILDVSSSTITTTNPWRNLEY